MQFRVTSGGRERDGPWSAGPNWCFVVAAVAQFHCHTTHAMLDPSLRPESVLLFVLCSCNFVERGDCHSCFLCVVCWQYVSRPCPAPCLQAS